VKKLLESEIRELKASQPEINKKAVKLSKFQPRSQRSESKRIALSLKFLLGRVSKMLQVLAGLLVAFICDFNDKGFRVTSE
jgi:hypothetical protein